jgi:acetyl esterase/lipase
MLVYILFTWSMVCGLDSSLVYGKDTVLPAAGQTGETARGIVEQGMPQGGPQNGPWQGPPGNMAPAIDQSAYKNKFLDQAYANMSAAQKLDIYLPEEGTAPFPLIIVIHGGGWASGDKASGQVASILTAVKMGYAVASINYRLSGEAKFPAQIYDVKAAIRFLRANAEKYRLDPDTFAVWGDSAGGHLASLAGTSGGVSEVEDPAMGNSAQSSSVQAVVDWYGPIDLIRIDRENSAERNLIGSPLADVPELARKSNPVTYISKDDPPFLIQHGNKDSAVPMEQSVNFASALEKVLGKDKVALDIIDGAGHVDKAFETPENISHILDFLDKVLK